jgi:hypothetical protein
MKDMCSENQEKFAIFPKGVHGFEIPQFSHDKDMKHWEQRKDFVKNPPTKS